MPSSRFAMVSMRRLAALSAAAALAGCYPIQPIDKPVGAAQLIRSDGANIGTVRLFQEPTGLVLRIDARGLPPGLHGAHVHATGRCDPPGFTTAGPHWNPTSRQHGHQNPAGYHVGDLGNVGVGSDGRLVAGLLIPGAALWSGTGAPALSDGDGAALVIHAKPDDERTDPSGNSGDRIACAVIVGR